MTRLFLIVFSCFLVIVSGPYVRAAQTEGIAAIVNDDAISYSDIENRMRMVISSTGFPDTPELREKILPQVLGGLIEEQIKLQEANELELSVSDAEINAQFAALAQQNNMTPEEFQSVLDRGWVSKSTLMSQMSAQIAWRKVIQASLFPQIKVTESDIESSMERLKNNIGKESYLLAEIYLPVEDPSEEKTMKQLSDRLIKQLTEGKSSFYKVAQQFSKAAGAAQGGNMGWVQKDQLPDELAAVVGDIQKDEISPPIRSLTGYHILFVRDKRVLEEANLPTAEDLHNQIGNERLEQLQRRRYMDLKATAFIESRV